MSRLDKAGAHRRAQRVRDGVVAIDDVIETLIEIQERQDWFALGYKSFSEYCEGEFGPAKLKLTAEQRGRVVALLASSGLSKRKVALALGVSEGTVRNDVKRSEGAQNYALSGAKPQVNNTTAAADADIAAADGEHIGASNAGSSAEGSDERPSDPSVTPTEDHRDGEPGETDDVRASSAPLAPAGVSEASGTTEPAGAEQPPPSLPELAEEVEGQDEAGAPRPAPAPSDPAALIDWFAEQWEQVDADVSGPLLTDEDMQMIGGALDRIVFVVELLTKWRDRAQP